uniref:Uncharacterized protein n=1 Tax=Sphaerodactylus townsendi TaxID=933632 RepID=A0ACB8EIL7_9SAUR
MDGEDPFLCSRKGSEDCLIICLECIKRSPEPPEAAGDKDRTVTINPCHMGKAFKVMNELRRVAEVGVERTFCGSDDSPAAELHCYDIEVTIGEWQATYKENT